jgi:integrase
MAKITQTTVGAALRRVDGKLVPAVVKDSDIPGLALHVTTRRAFYAVSYQPRGRNPATHKRWGGATRHELGDAFALALADARAQAMEVKALVRQGRDPHREALAARAAAIAERERPPVTPTTLADALALYADALAVKRQPSEASRRQSLHYATKAVALMRAEGLAASALGVAEVRLMVETLDGSDAERRHVFGGLSRFLSWCRRQGLIEQNPCASLERDEKPKPGRPRDHAPSIGELERVWTAVESEAAHVRDLVWFLLLTPLRLNEAAGLRWSEVDAQRGWIKIAAHRMKNGEAHELPLSPEALAIVMSRRGAGEPEGDALLFPSSSGKPFDGWTRLMRRVRARIGQGEAEKRDRFSLHDIRRAFATHLAERFDENLLDLMLAHRPASRAGASAAYQKARRLGERVAVMTAWSRLVTGEDPSGPSNVVAFRAAAG